MKRLTHFVLLVAGVFMTQSTFGQVEFGAKAGASFSDMTVKGLNLGMDLFEPQMIISPSAGLYSEMPLGNGFYFAPELNYTQKGFRVQESTNVNVFGVALPIGVEATTRFHYIDMPLTLKYKFGQGSVQGYVRAGPTVGYAVSGVVTTRLNSIIDIKVAETDLDPQGELYNAFEIGGVVGAGFEIPTASGKFFIDAGFSHGFTDVLNEPIIDLRVNNRAISVGIGYALRF